MTNKTNKPIVNISRRAVLGSIGAAAATSTTPSTVAAESVEPVTTVRIGTTSLKFDVQNESVTSGYRSSFSRHRIMNGNLFALNPMDNSEFEKITTSDSLLVEDGRYHNLPYQVTTGSINRIDIGPHQRSTYNDPVPLDNSLSIPAIRFSNEGEKLVVGIRNEETEISAGELRQLHLSVPNLKPRHLRTYGATTEVETTAVLTVSYHGRVDVYDTRGEEWVTEGDTK